MRCLTYRCLKVLKYRCYVCMHQETGAFQAKSRCWTQRCFHQKICNSQWKKLLVMWTSIIDLTLSSFQSYAFDQTRTLSIARFQANALNRTLYIERFISNALNQTLYIERFESNALNQTLSIEHSQSNAFNQMLSIKRFQSNAFDIYSMSAQLAISSTVPIKTTQSWNSSCIIWF